MINETLDVAVQAIKGDIYTPVVITVWALTVSLFVVIALLVNMGHKVKWDNFRRIWIWTAIGSGILVTIFVMSPTSCDLNIKSLSTFLEYSSCHVPYGG